MPRRDHLTEKLRLTSADIDDLTGALHHRIAGMKEAAGPEPAPEDVAVKRVRVRLLSGAAKFAALLEKLEALEGHLYVLSEVDDAA